LLECNPLPGIKVHPEAAFINRARPAIPHWASITLTAAAEQFGCGCGFNTFILCPGSPGLASQDYVIDM
jgi:hypothetical protein